MIDSHLTFLTCTQSCPNIVGLEDTPSTISWGRIGLEALNLTAMAPPVWAEVIGE